MFFIAELFGKGASDFSTPYYNNVHKILQIKEYEKSHIIMICCVNIIALLCLFLNTDYEKI